MSRKESRTLYGCDNCGHHFNKVAKDWKEDPMCPNCEAYDIVTDYDEVYKRLHNAQLKLDILGELLHDLRNLDPTIEGMKGWDTAVKSGALDGWV